MFETGLQYTPQNIDKVGVETENVLNSQQAFKVHVQVEWKRPYRCGEHYY